MLPVVLFGCEAWSLTLRAERKLRVFENRTLRRAIEPNKYENEDLLWLHNEELHS